MKRIIKRVLGITLTICLILTMFSTNILEVFAADNEQSDYMQYWTNITDGAYNINGKVEGFDEWLCTEYSDAYDTCLKIGDSTFNLYSMENGVEKLISEFQLGITQNLSLVNNGRYIKIQYIVRNTSDLPQTISLGSCADVEIGGDDYADITKFSDGSGFYMTGDDPAAQFNFIGKNAYGVTDVDTFWFGYYGDRNANQFNQVEADSLTDTDSGMAFSWKDEIIPVSGSQTFSVLIGVGSVNKAPTLAITDPEVTLVNVIKGGNYNFSGTVSDEENSFGTEVYYAIDDGEPIKAFTFTEAPGNFDASITLPSDISLGNHTLSFYAQDLDGAISSVITRDIEVINMYTVTFVSNGGTNINPITDIATGSTIVAPTVPTKTGYTFDGWFKDSQFTNAWNFDTDKVTDNTSLYAKWKLNVTNTTTNNTVTTNTVTTNIVTIPKTGDTLPIAFLFALIIVSGSVFTLMLFRFKKSKMI